MNRSLASYTPLGHKESDMTEQLTHTCRYVITFEELVNQEHRGRKRDLDISKFEIRVTYKCSSCGKTPCISHSGQITRRKDKLILMPIMSFFTSESTRL